MRGSSFPVRPSAFAALLTVVFSLIVHTYGGCEFKSDWAGKWFISGVPSLLSINSSWIESKGACVENVNDKYMIHDVVDNCFRCMVIHEKHHNVLQYKETYCDKHESLDSLCNQIAGDATLYSMFRVDAASVPCPFKSPPFTFSYNRGNGECGNPPSRVDGCTDDSRLSFKYLACHDVEGTESTVEELQCLALWKDGSVRYMVGKVEHNRVNSDEDTYRCFVYEKAPHERKVIYNIAQSGDATCTGLTNAQEGSKTIRLIRVENTHTRCRYPTWVTEHHKWHTLDYNKSYHFSHKNATLRIISDDAAAGLMRSDVMLHGSKHHNMEMRVVCHKEELSEPNRTVVVAHVTSGCESGYLCVAFYRRDAHVIEYQQSKNLVQQPEEACNSHNFDSSTTPYVTLITATLPQRKCPHLGQYNVIGQWAEGRSMAKRSNTVVGGSLPTPQTTRKKREGLKGGTGSSKPDCDPDLFESVNVGCTTSGESMEFHSHCNSEFNLAYSCFGSWEENGTHYLIASPTSRKSTEARRYCFTAHAVFDKGAGSASGSSNGVARGEGDKRAAISRLMLSAVSDNCDRSIIPGVTGIKAFNLTFLRHCPNAMSADTGTSLAVPSAVICVALLSLALTTR